MACVRYRHATRIGKKPREFICYQLCNSSVFAPRTIITGIRNRSVQPEELVTGRCRNDGGDSAGIRDS